MDLFQGSIWRRSKHSFNTHQLVFAVVYLDIQYSIAAGCPVEIQIPHEIMKLMCTVRSVVEFSISFHHSLVERRVEMVFNRRD